MLPLTLHKDNYTIAGKMTTEVYVYRHVVALKNIDIDNCGEASYCNDYISDVSVFVI